MENISSTSLIDGSQKPSLDALLTYLGKDLERVNAMVIHEVQSQVQKIPQVALHLLQSGGKQIRVLLALGSAHLCGYAPSDQEEARHIQLGAVVELLHTATLLHDDVVDESPLRRGVPAAQTVFGNTLSILVGDFLLTRAFDILIQMKSWEIIRLLNQMTSLLTQGEVMEIDFKNNIHISKQAYFDMIFAKTACFFSMVCEIGAVIARGSQAMGEALKAFGHGVGMAFQLVDDVLDYQSIQSRFGKRVGQDFLEGSITLPVLLAYEQGTPDQRKHWEALFKKPTRTQNDLDLAMAYMDETQSLKQTFDHANAYVAQAIKALAVFPESPLKQALQQAALFVTQRGF